MDLITATKIKANEMIQEYYHAKFSFKDLAKKEHSIEVVHNLGEGDKIHRVLKLWLTHTEDYSVGDFCKFVISKSPRRFACLTIPQWNNLIKQE
jgi:hypothetical protein